MKNKTTANTSLNLGTSWLLPPLNRPPALSLEAPEKVVTKAGFTSEGTDRPAWKYIEPPVGALNKGILKLFDPETDKYLKVPGTKYLTNKALNILERPNRGGLSLGQVFGKESIGKENDPFNMSLTAKEAKKLARFNEIHKRKVRYIDYTNPIAGFKNPAGHTKSITLDNSNRMVDADVAASFLLNNITAGTGGIKRPFKENIMSGREKAGLAIANLIIMHYVSNIMPWAGPLWAAAQYIGFNQDKAAAEEKERYYRTVNDLFNNRLKEIKRWAKKKVNKEFPDIKAKKENPGYAWLTQENPLQGIGGIYG